MRETKITMPQESFCSLPGAAGPLLFTCRFWPNPYLLHKRFRVILGLCAPEVTPLQFGGIFASCSALTTGMERVTHS